MRRPPIKGLLVTFEGTEGAGKSTLIQAIKRALVNESVTLTREPGGSPTAERIRELILAQAMDPWCELFLYEAARAEHVAKTLLPALSRGEIVLCDRYADSSLAYQAHARGLDWKKVSQLNTIATQALVPHMTVLLDIDPALGLARAKDRNRFEDEGVAFQTRVRQGFLKAKKESPKRWLVINSSKSASKSANTHTKKTKIKVGNKSVSKTPEELGAQVVRELKKRFPKYFRGRK
jgi:dTMP kinase